jgi:hypothetical protein
MQANFEKKPVFPLPSGYNTAVVSLVKISIAISFPFSTYSNSEELSVKYFSLK